LLGAAGAAKVARPADTARALTGAGLPITRALVRAGAVMEIVLAGAAVVWAGPLTGALVGAAYALFAVFIVVALHQRWALSSCGCFGRPDTRPTVAHAALNAGAAAAAVWWALAWPGGSGLSRLGHLFSHQPWHGGPLALVTVVVAGMAYLLWTDPRPALRRTEGR
jgi:hypothetical protein